MTVAGSTKLVTLLCAILTAGVIILSSIATAGMTKSTPPLVDLPVGHADVRKLDVNKIVPQASNVLHFLGAAMLSDKVTDDEVFEPLKKVAETEHLRSLLMLLVNGRSYQTTIGALNQLSPIALETDEESLTSIKGLHQIISLSNDQNKTIDGLQAILAARSGASASNTSQAAASASLDASVALQALLANSRNPAATVSNLVKLGELGTQQTARLAPYISLLGQTTNVSLTLESLNQVLSANISSETTNQFVSQITASPNPSATLEQYANSVSTAQADALRALVSLLGTFPNPTGVLNILAQSNTTEARDSLRVGIPIFIELSNNAKNTTIMLNNVPRLAIASTPASRASLKGLSEVLEASTDQEATLGAISGLTSSPISPNTAKSVPPLFALLKDSNNITDSFDSLLDITGFAIQNRETFSPIVRVVDAAADDKEETFRVNEHVDVVERMFQNFDIPTDYRMGIFNLCALRADGSVKGCTKQHAVQDFDFRNIVYDNLKDSDIHPYLVALDIGADDLYLEGRMLQKQHMYVPAMRALLAFDLLALIFAFFLIITLLVTFYNPTAFSYQGLINKVLAILVASFAFFSAIVAVVVTAVIKDGTSHDKYGVVYKGGAGFTALQWVSVCLAVITAILVWITVKQAKHKNGDGGEGHLSNSEEEFAKEPKPQLQNV